MIKEPFLEDAKLRKKFSKNIENMAQADKDMLAYIWLAKSSEGEELCQYDVSGAEMLYKPVLNHWIPNGKLKELWFIPTNEAHASIGIKYGKDDIPLKNPTSNMPWGIIRTGGRAFGLKKNVKGDGMHVTEFDGPKRFFYKIGVTRMVDGLEEHELMILDHWGRRKLTKDRNYIIPRGTTRKT